MWEALCWSFQFLSFGGQGLLESLIALLAEFWIVTMLLLVLINLIYSKKKGETFLFFCLALWIVGYDCFECFKNLFIYSQPNIVCSISLEKNAVLYTERKCWKSIWAFLSLNTKNLILYCIAFISFIFSKCCAIIYNCLFN